jgi:hypothetical protein
LKTNQVQWAIRFATAIFLVCGSTAAYSTSYCPKNPKVTIRVPGTGAGIIKANTTFLRGKKYYSPDKSVYLVFQSDGNLVLYKLITPKYLKALWDTATFNSSARCAVFQADGNLVVYNTSGNAVWDSFTAAKNRDKSWTDNFPPYGIDSKSYNNQSGTPFLAVQDDNNLVVYDGNSKPLWDSGTSAH